MPGRHRSRVGGYSFWTQDIYGSISSGANDPDFTEECDDIIGQYGGEHSLDLIKIETSGGCLDGEFSGRKYSNRGTFIRSTGFLFPPASQVAIDGNTFGSSSTKAAARTNPSRPEINVPVSLVELREVPKMLRHAGRFLNGTAFKHGNNGLSAAKEVAAENLAIQFGWAPILSDLAKIAEFQKRYDRRVNELNRLYSGSGLKRRIDLGSWSASKTVNVWAWSTHGIYVNVPVVQNSVARNWAVVKWQPDSPARAIPGSDDFNRKLLGLTPSNIPSAAWELLPWSWLTDYFSNMGDYISLTNNHLLAKCIGGTIMHNGVLTSSWNSKYIGGSLHFSAGYRRRTSKHRRPFTAFDFTPISGSFPILSGRQTSILSSLAMLRV